MGRPTRSPHRVSVISTCLCLGGNSTCGDKQEQEMAPEGRHSLVWFHKNTVYADDSLRSIDLLTSVNLGNWETRDNSQHHIYSLCSLFHEKPMFATLVLASNV